MMGMRMMMAGTASTKSHTTTNSAVRGRRGTREPAAVVFRSWRRVGVPRTGVPATGDAFCAARACAAGAIAASRPDAQPSLTAAAELEEILAR
jgi:hypothetical protein